MNNVIDAEVQQAVIRRPSSAVGQALAVDEIVAQVNLIQQVMAKVMKDGEHYGTIPGCGDKKTLLQPGAQKLTMTFRLAPEYEIQEVNLDRGHKEYRVICTLKNMNSGSFVGQGVGCCSSMESKYRWRGGARKCPECGKESIIKGKSEYGGGWLCWKNKGGCGLKWPDGAEVIESQSIDKVENDNPADTFNTVLKMAKKRAFVDATITATAASDIFTQDIGDDEGDHHEPTPPLPAKPAPKPAPVVKPPTTTTKLKPATEGTRKWMIEAFKGSEDLLCEYFGKAGCLLPGVETLYDMPLRWVPITTAQLDLLRNSVKAFSEGAEAQPPYPSNGEQQAPPVANDNPELEPAAPKHPKDDEAWREFVIPVPPKGVSRAEYMVNPQTIGQLFDMRHGDDEESAAARTRLFGFVSHYEPKGWQKRDGTKMPPSEIDKAFRVQLDAFADYFQRNHPGERL